MEDGEVQRGEERRPSHHRPRAAPVMRELSRRHHGRAAPRRRARRATVAGVGGRACGGSATKATAWWVDGWRLLS